jgi:hypothetical protein
MAAWAKYCDGVEVSEEVFRTLAAFAPTGTQAMIGRTDFGY